MCLVCPVFLSDSSSVSLLEMCFYLGCSVSSWFLITASIFTLFSLHLGSSSTSFLCAFLHFTDKLAQTSPPSPSVFPQLHSELSELASLLPAAGNLLRWPSCVEVSLETKAVCVKAADWRTVCSIPPLLSASLSSSASSQWWPVGPAGSIHSGVPGRYKSDLQRYLSDDPLLPDVKLLRHYSNSRKQFWSRCRGVCTVLVSL